MDIQLILTAVSTVGFPIVGCCALAYFFAKTTNNYREDLKQQNAEHRDEIRNLAEVINRNTLVIQSLCDKLDKE